MKHNRQHEAGEQTSNGQAKYVSIDDLRHQTVDPTSNPTGKPLPSHPYISVDKLAAATAAQVEEPIGVREYLLYLTVAIASLLAGGSIVHNIFKPDLTLPNIAEQKRQEQLQPNSTQ